ncbi:hypothetical protein AAFF_G00027050 [Aldrovandia affinis]|uniref:Uncharacterized protein n=1 Tax=Aldrovandia affinis TaxID=143900 RepID=A0AAD7R2G7_9TELE|nr:hypothetical protein AAFF_G00027050 [Aldrovandia affinis]
MRFQSYRNEGHWSPCVLCCRQPSPPSVGSKTANKNLQIQFGSVDNKIWEQFKNRLTTQKQVPSLRRALKSVSSIRHQADQRMTSLSGQQCGPVE